MGPPDERWALGAGGSIFFFYMTPAGTVKTRETSDCGLFIGLIPEYMTIASAVLDSGRGNKLGVTGFLSKDVPTCV